MTEYDDGAYYEVQLNNKQLVFFFMAALAIAVVVFLCGVMVGRGVRDATLAVAQNDITAGPQTNAVPVAKSAVESRPELDYARRLESNDVPRQLDPPGTMKSTSPETVVTDRSQPPAGDSGTREASSARPARPEPGRPTPRTSETATRAAADASPMRLGKESGPFTIQVVALKTEDAAQSLLARLRGKNYRAYLESESDAGLHRVRVGRFATRAEAERVAARLRDEEKFKPYITQ